MSTQSPGAPVLTVRALNRATLERQHLLRRSTLSVVELLETLVGMQAQTPHTAYVGLWTRLEGFRPDDLAERLLDRSVVRLALQRGTIHLVTARDAWGLRPLVQPVLDRALKGQFGKRLDGVDLAEVVAVGRAFVDTEPRTFKALGDHLLTRWPDRDRMALEQAVRAGVTLIQVPPRGLWGRSGPVAHTSIEAWLGEPPAGPRPTLDDDDPPLPRCLRAGERHGCPGVVWPDPAGRGVRAAAPGADDLPGRAWARAVRPPRGATTGAGDPRAATLPVRLREHPAVVRRPVAGDPARRSSATPRRGPRNRSARSRSTASSGARGGSTGRTAARCSS